MSFTNEFGYLSKNGTNIAELLLNARISPTTTTTLSGGVVLTIAQFDGLVIMSGAGILTLPTNTSPNVGDLAKLKGKICRIRNATASITGVVAPTLKLVQNGSAVSSLTTGAVLDAVTELYCDGTQYHVLSDNAFTSAFT
jgi:hypothetical protein